jgi:hypothetical protein
VRKAGGRPHKSGQAFGNSGAGTIVDLIRVDKLTLGGTSGITMDLNPTRSFSLMKATLPR